MPERGVVYSVGRDATERRRVEAELHEAQRVFEASRDELRVLADEQAALRRVATRSRRACQRRRSSVWCATRARRSPGRYLGRRPLPTDKRTVTLMGTSTPRHPVGARLDLDPDYVVAEDVHRTGRAARFDTDDPAAPGIPEVVRAERVRSALASPIVVEGEFWGAITTGSRERSLAADMERRLADFTELVAIAIANADSRDQLTASRARLLSAGDEARRRVVRDLHDGAQQRLVHTIVTLIAGSAGVPGRKRKGRVAPRRGDQKMRAGQSRAARARTRDPARSAHPGWPAGRRRRSGGTAGPAGSSRCRGRAASCRDPASAYFIVAEALTNVVKHWHAGRAEVAASLEEEMLRIEVRENSTRSADTDRNGLVGFATG